MTGFLINEGLTMLVTLVAILCNSQLCLEKVVTTSERSVITWTTCEVNAQIGIAEWLANGPYHQWRLQSYKCVMGKYITQGRRMKRTPIPRSLDGTGPGSKSLPSQRRRAIVARRPAPRPHWTGQFPCLSHRGQELVSAPVAATAVTRQELPYRLRQSLLGEFGRSALQLPYWTNPAARHRTLRQAR